MTCITEIDPPYRAVESLHHKKGQIMVHRAAFSPAINREANLSLPSKKPGGSDILQRRQGRLLELIREVASIPINVFLVCGGDRNAEDGLADVFQHRRAVSMRGRNGEPLAFKSGLFQTLGNLLGDLVGNAKIIRRDENERSLFRILKSERLRPNSLRDSFRLG